MHACVCECVCVRVCVAVYVYIQYMCINYVVWYMVDFRFFLFKCMLMGFFVMSCFNSAVSLIRLENTAL